MYFLSVALNKFAASAEKSNRAESRIARQPKYVTPEKYRGIIESILQSQI